MARKHLIVPTQYFEPETFQINHLVSLFLAKGWFVTVIAPDPSYPSESVLKGCTSPSLRHRRLRICRFPIIKRDGSLFAAAINSIIFAVSGSFFAIYFSLRHPKAHIFAVQYSPFTCIVPAFVAVSMLNRRASLWVFDLWPQSISALLGGSPLTRLMYSLIEYFVSIIYSPFANFFVSSPSFMLVPPLNGLKGVELLYSWEPSDILPRFGCESDELSLPIRVISIGNLGSAHDLDLLENLLLYTGSLEFNWSFVGGGSGMLRIRSFCSLHELKNVSFHGFMPKVDTLQLCSKADLSIVPFRESEISDTICYRFISSLSVATPVISFGENAVSELVRAYSCGFILSDSNCAELPCSRNSSSPELIPGLVVSIRSQLASLRSSARVSAFELFQSRFSQRAAEKSLRKFFVNV